MGDHFKSAALGHVEAQHVAHSLMGASPLTYQWRKNGVSMAGATAGSAAPSDASAYNLVVFSAWGPASSISATLTAH